MMTATKQSYWLLTIILGLASCISNAQAQQHGTSVQMTPLNRDFAIKSVESSRDGRYSMVTTFKEIRVIDNKTRAEILAFVRLPHHQVFKIGSIDGRCVIAVMERSSNSYSLAVYDPRTDQEIIRQQIPRFTEQYGLEISGDGRKIMLINRNITVFDTLTLNQLSTVKSPMRGSGHNFFIPGSNRLLMAGMEKKYWTLKLWDYQTDEFVSWKKQDEPIHSVAVSPNGETAAVSYRSGVKILDLSRNSDFEVRKTIETHLAPSGLGFSENGRFLWAVNGGALQGWEMESGKRIADERFEFKYFCLLPHNSRLQFVPVDDRFALNEMDLKPAASQSVPPLWSHYLSVKMGSKVHMTDNGKVIYWNAQHKQFRQVDLKTGQSLGELPLPPAAEGEHDKLLSGGLFRVSSEKVHGYDFRSGQFVPLFSPDSQWEIASVAETENAGVIVRCKSNAPDVQFFAQRDHSETRVYLATSDFATVKRLPNFHAFEKACFSPTMKYVALWTPKRTRVWNLERRLEMGECSFENMTGFIGEQLLGKQRDDQFLFDWQNESTSRFASLAVGGKVKMLAEGAVVVSASGRILRLWDSSGHAAIGAINLGQSGEVSDIQISPDNRYLLVQFAEGHVGVWNLRGSAGSNG